MPGRSTRDPAATDLPGRIDIGSGTISIHYQSNDTLLTFHTIARIPAGTLPVTVVWEDEHHSKALHIHVTGMRLSPRLLVSHEINILTRISRIPCITDNSNISFPTVDILPAQDGLSYEPGRCIPARHPCAK